MELPFINLQLGWPSRDLLPASALSSAATTCLADPALASTALLYGPGLGNIRLRTAVSKWLSLFYQPVASEISDDRICISGGASQNIANILQVYTDPGYTRVIWMIEPVYHLACKIFEDAGFQGKLRGVPEDDEGIDIGFLREKILAVEEEWALEKRRSGEVDEPGIKRGDLYPKIFKHVVYCVPTFSNPSAKTMSLRRREELVGLAREFDGLVISDDCYDFLRWPVDDELGVDELGRIPPRLVDVDRVLDGGCSRWGNTVSNGTFSKLVGPGVRVGWCEGTPDFVGEMKKVGSTSSGGNPSQFTSTFIAHLLETNVLQQHINTLLIPTYRRRYRVLTTAITKHLVPLNIQITTGTKYATSLHRNPSSTLYTAQEITGTIPEAGGFFTYITLPSDLPNARIVAAKALSEYNLKVSFGEMFVVRGDRESGKRDGEKEVFERGMRLCWAWEEDRVLEAGVRRLATLIRELRREGIEGT